MDIEDMDMKINIQEYISFLEVPGQDHRPEKLTNTSEDAEVIPRIFSALESKFLHDVKFEETQFLAEVTGSEDSNTLNIDVADEDGKYPQPISISLKDEEDSHEKSCEVTCQCSTGSISNPQQDDQTALPICKNRSKCIEDSSCHSVIAVRRNLEWEMPMIEKYSENSLSNNSTKSELSFLTGVTLDTVTQYVDNASLVVQHKADTRSVNDKKDHQKSNVELNRLSLNYPIREYRCHHCGKSFGQKSNLNTHLIIHSGLREYTCSHCGKSFGQKGHLKTHLISHSGVREYNCDQCGKAFARKGILNKHLLTHSGLREYICDHCGKTFARKSILHKHLLTHSGLREYFCDHCGKSFAQKSNLNAHLILHSGIRKYTCHHCGKSFSQKSNLTRHFNIHLCIK